MLSEVEASLNSYSVQSLKRFLDFAPNDRKFGGSWNSRRTHCSSALILRHVLSPLNSAKLARLRFIAGKQTDRLLPTLSLSTHLSGATRTLSILASNPKSLRAVSSTAGWSRSIAGRSSSHYATDSKA